MRTFDCTCENTLFFDNSKCIQCDRSVVMCPFCAVLSPIEDLLEDVGKCGNSCCRRRLQLCENYTDYNVCNRGFADDEQNQRLCSYCRLNQLIPDLSIDGNLEKWRRLEAAKRRVLYHIEKVGFPLNTTDGQTLKFEFKAAGAEPVSTGHANGCITIRLREADDVEREKTRVQFGEPQRTLVGHFRHELGHYYWDLLVEPRRLSSFRALYGDEREPSYENAQRRYYEHGPVGGWQEEFISAYASMHPWEDFAETFAAYLETVAILDTAGHFKLIPLGISDFDPMLDAYRWLGVVVNELNRDMGLIDLVPDVFTPPVLEKLRFIHDLRR